MPIIPRRPFDDGVLGAVYFESDKDFVFNNFDECVAWLEREAVKINSEVE